MHEQRAYLLQREGPFRKVLQVAMAERLPTQIALGIQYWGDVTPEKIAVKYGPERITFARLNQMVSSFASRLDSVVDRTKLLPIIAGANLNSYLAVTSAARAGIGFAPIDSSNPAEAIDGILTQLGRPSQIVISDPAFASKVPSDCTIIAIDCSSDVNFPPRAVDASALATVLFTSGSTGLAKGVCLSWANLDSVKIDNARLNSMFKEIRCLSVYNSLAYLFGLWPSISASNGYTIAIRNPLSLTPDELIQEMNDHDVTNIGLVPSLIERICDTRSPTSLCTTVENVMLGGEGTNWEQIAKIRSLMAKDVEIVGMYGASEVSYVMFEYLVPSEPGTGKVPLGIPVNSDRIILDSIGDGSPLFEISVTEPIAMGYLNDLELTSAKFSVDDRGRRIYKTGDLAKLGPDGLYLHAGRVDDLIKINGRLVDPSESERHLLEITGIESAVVLPHRNDEGKFYLVGHVKVSTGSKISPSQIYEILLSKLANNLVPTKLVKHGSIPLNDRGKVDRQFLINNPWPRWTLDNAAQPSTGTESFVQETFARILKTPDLGWEEDIFGAGFDSIAAIEFMVIASEYGYNDLTPSAFLDYRTIRSIAAALDERRDLNSSHVFTLNSRGSKPPIFCIPGAGLTALWFREYASALGADQPMIVMEPRGLHKAELVDKTVEEQAQIAIADLLRISPSGRVRIIGHSAGGDVAFEISHKLSTVHNRETQLLLLDSHKVLEKLRTPYRHWRVLYLVNRVKSLFHRPAKEITRAVSRRFNSTLFRLTSGKGVGPRIKYDYFTLLAGASAANYHPQEPTFPIMLLYVKGSVNQKLWGSLPTLSTAEIRGTHTTLLNELNVGEVASATMEWFKI